MEEFRDKNILIVGGGDSALDWTLNLQPMAKRITLVHRRDDFRAAPHSVEQMRDAGRRRQDGSPARSGHRVARRGRRAVGRRDQGHRQFDVDRRLRPHDAVLRPDDEARPDRRLGPQPRTKISFRWTPRSSRPSTPGIFAIGDINTYPGKLKLILSGFHEGALAAQKVHRYVYPDKKLMFQYTTSSTNLQKKLGVS